MEPINVEEISKPFIAEDGLMNLHPEEERPPFPGYTLKTAGNDNAILFLVEYFWILQRKKLLDFHTHGTMFYEIVTQLRRKIDGVPQYGLFNRNPGRDSRDEAHDNYKAIVAGSVLFNFPEFIEEIVEYGKKTGYIYENVKPEEPQADQHLQERSQSTWFKVLGFDLTRWKQASDVAFYKMTIGYAPAPWEFLWLFGSMIVSMLSLRKLKTNGYTSEALLDWIMFLALERIYEKKISKETYRFKFYYQVMLGLVKPLWVWRLKANTDQRGVEKAFEIFFQNTSHPNRILSKGIVY